MFKKYLVRGVVVTCLVCLGSLPAPVLYAEEETESSAAPSGASELLAEVLDWLLGLVDEEPAEGDNGGNFDPAG